MESLDSLKTQLRDAKEELGKITIKNRNTVNIMSKFPFETKNIIMQELKVVRAIIMFFLIE